MTDKILNMLLDLEKQFGSVKNVPEDNPKLLEMRDLLEMEHRNRRGSYNRHKRAHDWFEEKPKRNRRSANENLTDRVIEYRDQGYTIEQIARAIGRSFSYTNTYMRKNGIKALPMYMYSVTDGAGTEMYFKNYREISGALGLTSSMVGKILSQLGGNYEGYVFKRIVPIAVNLPPDVLIKVKGKWKKAGEL